MHCTHSEPSEYDVSQEWMKQEYAVRTSLLNKEYEGTAGRLIPI